MKVGMQLGYQNLHHMPDGEFFRTGDATRH